MSSLPVYNILSSNFETFKEPKNRFQGANSARMCSLAGRYDNPIPTRFQASIDCLKIPALISDYTILYSIVIMELYSATLALIKRFLKLP